MRAYLLCILGLLFLQDKAAGKDVKNSINTQKANKKDLKYIECSVCENTFREIRNMVYKLHNTRPPTYLSELAISKVVDDVCNVNEQSWIRKQDILPYHPNNDSSVNGLKLIYRGDVLRCEIECKTIQESCRILIDDKVDREELVSYIHKQINKNHAVRGSSGKTKFETMVCKDWLKVCPAKNLPAEYERADWFFTALIMTVEEVEKEYSIRKNRMEKAAREEGIQATFELADDMAGSRVSLYWDTVYKGEMSNTSPSKHKTYPGHRWHAKINDKIVKSWMIEDEPLQYFSLSWMEVVNNKEL